MSQAEKSNRSQQNAHATESAESGQSEGLHLPAPAFEIMASSTDPGGLPPGLKYGVESESGFDLSPVRVVRNSSLPAQYGAHAFAKGLEVHLATGQEDKLPHELWHLVQQWRGEVNPTHELAGQAINQDKKLEEEATRMGEKANLQQAQELDREQLRQPSPQDVVQCLAVQISLTNTQPEKIESEEEENQSVVMNESIPLQTNTEQDIPATKKPNEASDKGIEIINEDEESSTKDQDEKSPETTVEDELPTAISDKKINFQSAIISRISIVGRPPKLFGKWMGDHTTAYSVHQKGLMVAMQNKSMPQAKEILLAQFEASRNLPGMEENTLERSERKEKLEELEGKLRGYDDQLQEALDGQKMNAVLLLQRMISTYLEFREEIPFSAMNIAAINPAYAGKGKGEAGPAKLLAQHQAKKLMSGADLLQKAIFSLLDIEGLARMVTQPKEEMLEAVMPGIDPTKSLLENLDTIIDQHFQTIFISFPDAFNDSSLVNDKTTREELIKSKIGPEILKKIKAEKSWIEESKINSEREDSMAKNFFSVEFGKKEKKYATEMEEYMEKLEDNADQKAPTRSKRHQDEFNSLQKREQKKIERDSDLEFYQTMEDSEFLNDAKIEAAKKPATQQQQSPKNTAIQENEAENEAGDAEQDARNEPIATELIVDDQNRLHDVRIEGRTPSPFPGTMGAHSTAWVVHLDELRAGLRGKEIRDAILEMHKMVLENKTKHTGMAQLITDLDQKHKGMLDEAVEKVDAYIGLEDRDASLWISELQSYINALLNYINLIPGSTFESANTNGRYEGAHRKTLLAYESGNLLDELIDKINNNGKLSYSEKCSCAVNLPKEIYDKVDASIKGLLDLKEVNGSETKKQLIKNHYTSIQKAYPKSYQLFGNGRPGPNNDLKSRINQVDTAEQLKKRKGKKGNSEFEPKKEKKVKVFQ